MGRLYKVLDEDDNRLQFYLYNAMGQVTQSSNNDGSAYSQYTYDELGRLTHKINQKWGTNLDTYDYTYDKVGNILTKTDLVGTTTYVYDNLYRLSSVTEPDTTKTAYTYDTSGNVNYKIIFHPDDYEYTYTVNGEEQTAGNLNIHRETYSYNSRNQLTSMTAGVYSGTAGQIDDTTAYTYDARGNLLSASRSGSSDSQVESYAYNLLGNMTSYTKDRSTTSYTYDSSGLRTSKTNGGTTTKYYLSGGMVLNEGIVTADGVTLSATNYIGNEIFGRKNATDTVTSYLLSNGHGDIETVMQNSTPVASYRYDTYGNTIAMTETDGFTNPIRYAGEYFDEESGNYYLRARYYNPTLGRFMAEDPAQDGQNWYAYCAGNPVMFVDPSGLDHYIFHGEDQLNAAAGTQAQLQEIDPDTPIHMIYVDSRSAFIDAWNSMGVDAEGNAVTIDNVFIHVHGEPDHLAIGTGVYADDLGVKTMDTIFLTACNTGNLDYENNFASQLAMSQNANQVIAPDGLGNFADPYSCSANYFGSANRPGSGFVTYQNINNTLYTTPNMTKNRQPFATISLLEAGQRVGHLNRVFASWIGVIVVNKVDVINRNVYQVLYK